MTHEAEAPEEMRAGVCRVLGALGMLPVAPLLPAPPEPGHLPVQLDGRVVGHVRSSIAPAMVAHLRAIKASALAAEESLTPEAKLLPLSGEDHALPSHAEVVYMPYLPGAPFPGIFIFTEASSE